MSADLRLAEIMGVDPRMLTPRQIARFAAHEDRLKVLSRMAELDALTEYGPLFTGLLSGRHHAQLRRYADDRKAELARGL